MKKHIWLLMGLASVGCYRPEQPIAPDSATRIAGIYELTYTYFSLTNTASTTRPGSLTLIRTNAQTVKPTFHLADIPDSLIESGTWNLTEVAKDSIFYRDSGYGGGIKNGQIDMLGYADGTYYFRFTKKQ